MHLLVHEHIYFKASSIHVAHSTAALIKKACCIAKPIHQNVSRVRVSAWHGPDLPHKYMLSRLSLFLHALLHALVLQQRTLPPAAAKIATSQHRQETIPAHMISALLYQPQDLVSVTWCLHNQTLCKKLI